jgi:hypothetical protein
VDWNTFVYALTLLYLWMIVQAFAAADEGYLTRAQMLTRGIGRGYSLLQHGGYSADLFVTLLIAYLMGRYGFAIISWPSLGLLMLATTFWLGATVVFSKAALNTPEAHTHDGRTTVAGWLQVVYASLASWIVLMTYCGLTAKPVTHSDLFITSLVLTPWAVMGVMKWSKDWHWDNTSRTIVTAEIAFIWTAFLVNVV